MTRMLKVTGFLVIVLLVLFSACSKKKTTKPEPPKYKWTILGYFDGNNSKDQALDGHSYVIKDVQELEQTGSTDNVQILAMVGSVETSGNCKYYHVEKHTGEAQDVISSPVLVDLGKKDMSDYTVLRDFIGYGMDNYSADRYMLIINDHGKGWRGLCSDNVNGSGDWMTLPELSSALYGYQFEIVWLYSPSMATAEVAYQLKDRAKYLVASEFKNYPDNIMGSFFWLDKLAADPVMNTVLFGLNVVTGVDSAAQRISSNKMFHAALIDLTDMAQVADAISDFSRDVVDSAGSYWSEVWDAWALARSEAYADSGYADLREFARQIQIQPNLNSVIVADAHTLESAVDEAVIQELEYPLYESTSGMAIHLPWNHEDFDSLAYAPLDFSVTSWPEFVSVFTQAYPGNYAGGLSIASNVTGAKIFLDGVDSGYETNSVIGGLYPRTYAVSLVKPGYHQNPDPKKVNVLPRETLIVYIYLFP